MRSKAVLGVETPAEGRSGDAPRCKCGCGKIAAPGSVYAVPGGKDNCRSRLWEASRPRLDLTGLTGPQVERAKRMVEDAVAAARQGQDRATIDARHPVKHQRDPRTSRRARIRSEVWSMLETMLGDGWCVYLDGADRRPGSVSELIELMVQRQYQNWHGGS